MLRVTYKEFYDYALNDGYSNLEITHLFRVLKSKEKQTRKWFINWFKTGIIPHDEIEGITAEYLINELKCKPINAFIILDWLKGNPKIAKFFVSKIPFLFRSKGIPQEISQQIIDIGTNNSDDMNDDDITDK